MGNKSLRFFLAGALALAGGCGLLGGGSDGGTNNGGGDGGNNGGKDGGNGAADLTMPHGPQMRVSWDLYLRGTVHSTMMQVNCDDPQATVTTMKFTVSNMGGTKVDTTVPCPKGMYFGDATVVTPDMNGNFAITVTPDGKAEPLVHADFDVRYIDDGFIAHVIVPFNDGP